MMTLVQDVTKDHPLDEEWCWQAVMQRDRAVDGRFVFAVHSTGIYCRPSCPARRPRREQVTFFQQSEAAEKAGFRACQRCRPQYEHVPVPQADLIEQIGGYIETHLDMPLRLSDLAQQFHLSPYHLQRTFKRVKGVTPRQYAEACRLKQFKAQLQDGAPVTRALYEAGYHSSSSMYERTPALLGMTPTTYRYGGKGMHIRYTIIKSSVGLVLLAATVRGLVTVRFSDSEEELREAFVREYGQAELEADEEGLRPWVTLLQDYLQGQPIALTAPLDVQATAFQWKVWEALRAIPAGSTRSYREVALAIGQPTAARAVARACATNPVAVFIPCHRVVRENGQMAGYRWGLARKQQLLALEQGSGS